MNGTEKQNGTSMEMPAEDSRVTMGNQTEKKHRFHLKMPQKGRKHSVKKRIAYTFIATMAATLLIIGLINYFFLGSFYIRDKEHILAESFQKLNATGGDSDDIPDTFEQFCVTNNLKVIRLFQRNRPPEPPDPDLRPDQRKRAGKYQSR